MKKFLIGILFSLHISSTYAQAFDPVPFQIIAGHNFVHINNQLPSTVTLYLAINVVSGRVRIHDLQGSSPSCQPGLVIPTGETRICTVKGPTYMRLGAVHSTGEGASGSYQIIIP